MFHLASYAKVGTGYVIGVNSKRNSTKFLRYYSDGNFSGQVHAEMDLLLKLSKLGYEVPSKIHVIRFTKKGDITMSLPCIFCTKHLRKAGVKQVRYTGWDGNWHTLNL